MSAQSRIQKAYLNAETLPFDADSRIAIMSDCHRGTGTGADSFAKNQNAFYAALNYYFRAGFTYIELGDGDELWENRHFPAIAREYSHIFSLLAEFHKNGRLFMLHGNHDMDKKNPAWRARWLEPLFPGIKIREGLILENTDTGQKILLKKILLIHGHQADFLNSRLWRLAKFLVRHIWRPLELVGVLNPFDAAHSQRYESVEKHLLNWCRKENTALAAGHTHRAIFPNEGEAQYFNSGSCVHRPYITSIEIEGGRARLVKWSVRPRHDNVLCVQRAEVR